MAEATVKRNYYRQNINVSYREILDQDAIRKREEESYYLSMRINSRCNLVEGTLIYNIC